MLAQSFMPAADLGLTDAENDALRTVLGMMERGEIADSEAGHSVVGKAIHDTPVGFNMLSFFGETECGTVACIGGWAIAVGRLNRDLITKRFKLPALDDLFDPSARLMQSGEMEKITTAQAARALRSYLTTGDAKWEEAAA